MRKFLVLAVAAAATVGMTSVASAQEQQGLTAKVTPSKLDKKKFKPAKIQVDVFTADNDENPTVEQPPKATRTVVHFSNNLKFNPGAVPQCKVSNATISNQSREQAKQLCGKDSQVSIDSGSSALIRVDFTPGVPNDTIPINVNVTAFNGKEKNTLYLHSDPEGVQTKPVLVGKLKKDKAPYGSKLDVTIPPLAAGGIADFLTTVKKKNYVTARCKTKKPQFGADSTYTDHSPTKATYTGSCKQKKSKKKK